MIKHNFIPNTQVLSPVRNHISQEAKRYELSLGVQSLLRQLNAR